MLWLQIGPQLFSANTQTAGFSATRQRTAPSFCISHKIFDVKSRTSCGRLSCRVSLGAIACRDG